MCDLSALQTANAGTIAQYDGAIGKILYFGKAVRDVDDADALLSEVTNDFEQSGGFSCRETGGWFVHDQDARID